MTPKTSLKNLVEKTSVLQEVRLVLATMSTRSLWVMGVNSSSRWMVEGSDMSGGELAGVIDVLMFSIFSIENFSEIFHSNLQR